jgi:hypothetical protein
LIALEFATVSRFDRSIDIKRNRREDAERFESKVSIGNNMEAATTLLHRHSSRFVMRIAW